MRYWLTAMRGLKGCALILALAGCNAAPEHRITSARIVRDPNPALEVAWTAHLTPTMLTALDHGIPLVLAFELRAAGGPHERRHLLLRYAALTQQYEWIDRELGINRHFARRSLLLAALDRVRLPLSPRWRAVRAGQALSLTLELDTNALPGPLRLPAQWDTRWQLHVPEWRWTESG